MRPIPLNLSTLYADLVQTVAAGVDPAATVSRRLVEGRHRLYADCRGGGRRRQVYLGTAGEAEAEAKAAGYRRAAAAAKLRRTISCGTIAPRRRKTCCRRAG